MIKGGTKLQNHISSYTIRRYLLPSSDVTTIKIISFVLEAILRKVYQSSLFKITICSNATAKTIFSFKKILWDDTVILQNRKRYCGEFMAIQLAWQPDQVGNLVSCQVLGNSFTLIFIYLENILCRLMFNK